MDDVIYCAFDTETTGMFDFDKPADAEGQPRLAEIGMYFLDSNLEITGEYHAFIKPDGWVMSEEAGAINGLTTEFLEENGVPVADVLAVWNAIVAEGRVFSAFNAQYDMKMMRAECRRAGMPDNFENMPNICVMRPLTDVCQIPHKNGRKGFKFPSLKEACEFFGVEQPAPHQGHADAMSVVHLMRRMKIIDKLPVAAIHTSKRPQFQKDTLANGA